MSQFNIGDKVRLKERYRNMDWDDRHELFYDDEVDNDIAVWWADNPDGEATITALMDNEQNYFAVDNDEDSFNEPWLDTDWFELVNQTSPTLRSVEEL